MLRDINPGLASRTCDGCRKWMYDENGEVIKRAGKPVARRGPVACETQFGCPKGHWNQSPDLDPNEEMAIDLYNASKCSGGNMLTDAERSDDFLMECFASLHTVEQSIARNRREREMSLLVKSMRGRQ